MAATDAMRRELLTSESLLHGDHWHRFGACDQDSGQLRKVVAVSPVVTRYSAIQPKEKTGRPLNEHTALVFVHGRQGELSHFQGVS
jgi:hypothetical protein